MLLVKILFFKGVHVMASGSCLFSVPLIAISFYQGLNLKYVSLGYRHIQLYGANGAVKFAISTSMYYYCFVFSDFPAISDTPHCNSVFTNQVSGNSNPCDLDARGAQFISLLRHLTILIQISLHDPLSANSGYTSLCWWWWSTDVMFA